MVPHNSVVGFKSWWGGLKDNADAERGTVVEEELGSFETSPPPPLVRPESPPPPPSVPDAAAITSSSTSDNGNGVGAMMRMSHYVLALKRP